ncbi:MAG: hypothetical protein L6W00_08805 [Lentisphaeria bacterium]|nr:MAG: hypothetical protein L6W00_29475 [Lentisphaeria bacterium]UKI32989.1 MAG: hypothetical protein L6W00_05600 [Lentisphaeria bacterium]UKI33438.1 MAG: hypothetical protein L6W00_08325 [Lentisphaeria bacterium]UKI33516.1 MAG: hypothetical protein L6W00_08805 [Lentisphaeria bacterium]
MKKSFDFGVIRIGQEARKTGRIGNPAWVETAHFGKDRTAFQIPDQVGNAFDVSRLFVDQRLEIGGTPIATAAEFGKIRLVVDQIESAEKCIVFFSGMGTNRLGRSSHKTVNFASYFSSF